MTARVGLSGGIGTGKTTVRIMLEDLGASTICADTIVHHLQAAGMPMLDDLASEFGGTVITADGELDRKALADLVFSDPEARLRLGRIVHPEVTKEMMKQAATAIEARAPMVVLDIPLLFEGKKAQSGSAVAMDYDALLLVWVPPDLQIQRTVERDGCTEEEARRRIEAQMPIDEKRELASHIIDNTGPIEDTELQVDHFWNSIIGL